MKHAQPNQNATVVIHTHGCKLNQADSSRLARQFAEAGYRVVPDGSPADVYVLNTCTVTAVADAKARQFLRSARRSNPDAIVVATAGCYPQRSFGRTRKNGRRFPGRRQHRQGLPRVPRHRSPDRKRPRCSSGRTACRAGTRPLAVGQPARFPTPRHGQDSGRLQPGLRLLHRAEGARTGAQRPAGINYWRNQPPCLRGRPGGRPHRDPARLLRLRPARHQPGRPAGTGLSETDVPRIRVSSLQPQEITGRLLSLWDNPRLCPHFHVPSRTGAMPS